MSRYQIVAHRCALLLLLAVVATSCMDSMTGPGPVSDTPMSPPAAGIDALSSLQATPPGDIRIGVAPSATELTLGAAGATFRTAPAGW
jgi:hypothetical protein